MIEMEEQWALVRDSSAQYLNECMAWMIDEWWAPLQVPAASVYQDIWQHVHDHGQESITNGAKTFYYLGLLLYWIFRPVCILLHRIAAKVCAWVYRHIIIDIVSKYGGPAVEKWSQIAYVYISKWSRQAYEYQMSLPVEYWIAEAAFVIALVILYMLVRWIQRQQFARRIREAIQRRVTAVRQAVQRRVTAVRRRYMVAKRRTAEFYQKTVNRIAQISLALAMSIPHVAFVVTVLLIQSVMPTVWGYLACETSLIFVLKWIYPTLSTILHIHRAYYAGRQDANENSLKADGSAEVGSVSNQNRQTKQEASGATSVDSSKKTATLYWLQYWLVHGCCEIVYTVIAVVPLSRTIFNRFLKLDRLSKQAEFFFYCWIFVIPLLLPTSSPQEKKTHKVEKKQTKKVTVTVTEDGTLLLLDALIKSQPLELMSPYLGPLVEEWYRNEETSPQNIETTVEDNSSKAQPLQRWRNFAMSWIDRFLSVAVFMRVLKEPTAEMFRNLLKQYGQSLFVPFILLFVPLLAPLGLLYVQYIVPAALTSQYLHKHHKKTRASAGQDYQERDGLLQLKFWVLHALLTGFIWNFKALLWVIPFSNVMLFAGFVYVSLPTSVISLYDTFQEDLMIVGLLPDCRPRRCRTSINDTTTAKIISWILEKLPRAASEGRETENLNNEDDSDEAGNAHEYSSNNASSKRAPGCDIQNTVESAIIVQPADGQNSLDAVVAVESKELNICTDSADDKENAPTFKSSTKSSCSKTSQPTSSRSASTTIVQTEQKTSRIATGASKAASSTTEIRRCGNSTSSSGDASGSRIGGGVRRSRRLATASTTTTTKASFK